MATSFDLYYLKLYDRTKQVRIVARKRLADYTLDDEYRQALFEIEVILAEIVEDVEVSPRQEVEEGLLGFSDTGAFLNVEALRRRLKSELGIMWKFLRRRVKMMRGIGRWRIESAWKELIHYYDDERYREQITI